MVGPEDPQRLLRVTLGDAISDAHFSLKSSSLSQALDAAGSLKRVKLASEVRIGGCNFTFECDDELIPIMASILSSI